MTCDAVQSCGRNEGHRGHHGGFHSLDRSDQLRPREVEVIRRFALGHTWEQIRADLGLSQHTLAHHRQRALDTFGGGCLVDLLRGLGWLTVPDVRRKT